MRGSFYYCVCNAYLFSFIWVKTQKGLKSNLQNYLKTRKTKFSIWFFLRTNQPAFYVLAIRNKLIIVPLRLNETDNIGWSRSALLIQLDIPVLVEHVSFKTFNLFNSFKTRFIPKCPSSILGSFNGPRWWYRWWRRNNGQCWELCQCSKLWESKDSCI